ncbi:unnamed protein product, partial [Linum tenue]
GFKAYRRTHRRSYAHPNYPPCAVKLLGPLHTRTDTTSHLRQSARPVSDRNVRSDLIPISLSSSTPNFPSPPASNLTAQSQKPHSSQLLRHLRQLITRGVLSVSADHHFHQRGSPVNHRGTAGEISRVKFIVDKRTNESLGFAMCGLLAKSLPISLWKE